MQRVTHIALKEMKRAQVEDWVDAARDRQFNLAGHISRRNDNRWSTVALNWAPSDGGRKVGHPIKRWEDDINQCLIALGLIKKVGKWRISAEDRETWQQWGVQSKEFWTTAQQEKDVQQEKDEKSEEGQRWEEKEEQKKRIQWKKK